MEVATAQDTTTTPADWAAAATLTELAAAWIAAMGAGGSRELARAARAELDTRTLRHQLAQRERAAVYPTWHMGVARPDRSNG